MKREIELKFRVTDFSPIRKKLRSLRARRWWAGREKSWYFDTPSGSLRKRGAHLRLRTTDETWLTYKEGIRHRTFKVAKEYQVKRIGDRQELQKILERLGFRVWLVYTKRREDWKLGRAQVTLDSLPFGKFVEIEASPRKIRALAKTFGFDFAKSTAKSYIQLLEEHRKKK